MLFLIYDDKSRQYIITVMESLSKKCYKTMEPHDERVVEVSFETVDVSPKDRNMMENSSNNVDHKKYMK